LNGNQTIEWIAVLFILFGAIVSVISALGMLRLPDVYTRSHAATKSATLSVLVCLLGAFIYFWSHDGYVSIRLILGIIFVFITAPVAGHLVCRAAYRSKVPLAEGSGEDELRPILFPENVAYKERELAEACEVVVTGEAVSDAHDQLDVQERVNRDRTIDSIVTENLTKDDTK